MNVNPFQPLNPPSAAKYSEWMAREVILLTSLSVATLLFVLACGYLFQQVKTDGNRAFLAGTIVMFIVGTFAIAMPMVSIGMQYNALKDAACVVRK